MIRMTKGIWNFLIALIALCIVTTVVSACEARELTTQHGTNVLYVGLISVGTGALAVALALFLFWKGSVHEKFTEAFGWQFFYEDLRFKATQKNVHGELREDALEIQALEKKRRDISDRLDHAIYLSREETTAFLAEIDAIDEKIVEKADYFESKKRIAWNAGFKVYKDALAYQAISARK